jgi:hypothetical protein
MPRSIGHGGNQGRCGVNFSEQPPSKQWAALKFKGEKIAEVWFKPDGDPLALMFRIPQNSFQIPGMGQGLTLENLLKAVAIAPEEIESWRHGDISYSALDASDPQLKNALPPPPENVAHLDIYVQMRPPDPGSQTGVGEPGAAVAGKERAEPEIVSTKWQDLEARWKAILGLEASMETLRISMEGARAELESCLSRALTTEEKLHALSADLTQWNKAKSRVHYALPKAKEFIHRATWAKGTPERKRLNEIFKNNAEAPVPLHQMDKVLEELEVLRKELQLLSAHGVAVHQECKSISAGVQGALRTLQSNSAARALKKKGAAGAKGKF